MSIALVALLHVVLVVVLLNAGFRTPATFDQEMLTVEMMDASPETFTAPPMPVPELHEQEPKDLPSTEAFVVQLPLTDEVPVDSAPVLATAVAEEVEQELARRAGLSPGQQATIVLRVEVLPTGRAGIVTVDYSGGSADIDAAAIEYARLLTWIAGRRGGVTSAMVVRMAAHLTG